MLFGDRDSRLYLAMIHMTRALHPDLLEDKQWDDVEAYVKCQIRGIDLGLMDTIAKKWLRSDHKNMIEHISCISRY